MADKIELPEKDVIDIIAMKVTANVDTSLQRRDSRWRLFYTILVGAFGVLGFTNINNVLENYKRSIIESVTVAIDPIIEKRVNDELDAVVDQKLNKIRGDLEYQIRLTRFGVLARKLEEEDSFSADERDSFIKTMVEIAEGKTFDNEFLIYAEKGMVAFTQANSHAKLDEITDKVGVTLAVSENIALSMREYYYSRIMGDPEVTEKLLSQLNVWSVGKELNEKETALYNLVKIGIKLREGRDKEEGRAFFEDIVNSSDLGREFLKSRITDYLALDTNDRPDHTRIKELTQKIINSYDFSRAFPECGFCAKI